MVKYFPHNTLHFSHSTTECWMSGTGPQLLELVWITLLKCDADLHNHLCTHVSDVWRLLEVMPLASSTLTINHIFVLKETAFFSLTNGYFLTWFRISKLLPMDATFEQLSQFQISAIFNCNLAKVVVLKRCQTLFTCLVSSSQWPDESNNLISIRLGCSDWIILVITLIINIAMLATHLLHTTHLLQSEHYQIIPLR